MAVVSLSVAKRFLRVAHALDDSLLTLLLAGAEEWVARECGVGFTRGTVVDCVDGGGERLLLGTRPVASVTEVVDLDDGSVWTSDDWWLRRDCLVLQGGSRWGEGRGRWQVTYEGGYDVVPAGLVEVVLQLLYRAYRNRGGMGGEGAGGWSGNWQGLVDGDLARKMRAYQRVSV